MSDRRTTSRRLWVLLGAVMLWACASVGVAQADPYGAISRSAEKGELIEPEAAFGVDPEDNSLYVVDKPDEGKKGFRLQKLIENSTTKKYEVVASAMFKPKGSVESNEVEGVAVDPARGRVYVLTTEERPSKKIDPETSAASELYAFQATQAGSKLEPASGTTGEGVLAGTSVFEPTSNSQGASLLEPSGIAVDPVNGDVIVTGHEDRGKVASEETPVLQAVEPSGKLGSKYVDEAGFFEEEDINSPVVSAAGNVYVIGTRDEIDEIPTKSGSLEQAGTPRHMFRFNCEEEETEGCASFAKQNPEVLTEFPGEDGEDGAQMSIGAEGDIYVRARIRLSEEAGERHGGVLILSPSFVEQGWTGGGSQLAGKPTEECSVRELNGARPLIAAGRERVFMLSRTEYEEGKVSPAIVEFGPNGKGCPKAQATVPTVKVKGSEVPQIPIADPAVFSSQVTQANALSVEWEFGDGSATQTVSTRAPETSEEISSSGHIQVYATTSIEHKFLKGGKLTVKERIHTDDLAAPVVEEQRTVIVVGAPGVTGEEFQVKGTSVSLKGSVDPYGKEITECFFEYGKASEGFPDKVACAPTPSGEEAVVVSAEVSGLAKLTGYHFRILAKNASGEVTEGAGKTFTSEEPVPVAVTGSGSAIAQTTVTINGQVNPEGETVKCSFQYGTSTGYGSEVACGTPLSAQQAPVAESASLSGLKAGQTYHFRIVAQVSGGKSYDGADKTFTTTAETSKTTTSSSSSSSGSTSSNTSTSVETTTTGTTGVLPEHVVKPPAVPLVTIASTSLPVSVAGVFDLKLGCPAEAVSCSGTISVKTLTAVAASTGRAAKSSKKAILTLASGSFAVVGGKPKVLALHLSAIARKLLAHSGVLRARVTLLAGDPGGGSHTTVMVVTLRLVKPRHHK